MIPAQRDHRPTAGDRARAADFLSRVLGRPVQRGLYVEQLAHMLADERTHTHQHERPRV